MLQGKSLTAKVNGVTLPNPPHIPYATIVTIDNTLKTWTISKNKGINLNWETRAFKSSNGVISVDNSKIYTQPSDVQTAIFIVPNDPAHTTGKTKYWLLKNSVKTFKITAADLSAFGRNERVDIYIGSAGHTNYATNGNNIDMASVNETKLPSIKLY